MTRKGRMQDFPVFVLLQCYHRYGNIVVSSILPVLRYLFLVCIGGIASRGAINAVIIFIENTMRTCKSSRSKIVSLQVKLERSTV